MAEIRVRLRNPRSEEQKRGVAAALSAAVVDAIGAECGDVAIQFIEPSESESSEATISAPRPID